MCHSEKHVRLKSGNYRGSLFAFGYILFIIFTVKEWKEERIHLQWELRILMLRERYLGYHCFVRWGPILVHLSTSSCLNVAGGPIEWGCWGSVCLVKEQCFKVRVKEKLREDQNVQHSACYCVGFLPFVLPLHPLLSCFVLFCFSLRILTYMDCISGLPCPFGFYLKTIT